MIESWLFVFAMIAVFLIPGPTNALLASSAHQQGIPKTILLIPAELLGYIYAISLWSLLIHLTSPVWPHLITLLHVLSALYVFWMAFHLWKSTHLQSHHQKHPHIRPYQLFFSILKNPKALLFSAGILPPEMWNSGLNAGVVFLVFSLILIPASLFWMVFGKAILAGNLKPIKADHLYKGSAMLLLICMLPVVMRFF